MFHLASREYKGWLANRSAERALTSTGATAPAENIGEIKSEGWWARAENLVDYWDSPCDWSPRVTRPLAPSIAGTQ